MSADERRRYARQLTLAGFGEVGQRALSGSHVLVVGAGGLGSAVITYLAGAGVGRLTIVDDDVVEASNLPRQIVHTEAFVGSAKVESARTAVRQQNAHVDVVALREAMTPELALRLVPECDLVVDATDSVEVRFVLNDACVLLGVPLVWASIAQFAGQLGVVDPGVGPCYRCVFPDPGEVSGGMTCEQGGVLGVLPGVMGTMQANEAIKVLTGLGDPVRAGILFYDALTATMTTIPLTRDPECVACGQGEMFVGVGRLGDRAGDGASGVGAVEALDDAEVVVDVRGVAEAGADPLTGAAGPGEVDGGPGGAVDARVVPWGSGWSDETLAQVAEWIGDRRAVAVCASGVRSRGAVEALTGRGIDAVSLRGGLSELRRRTEGRDASGGSSPVHDDGFVPQGEA